MAADAAATRILNSGELNEGSLFARFGFTRSAMLSAASGWLGALAEGPAPKPHQAAIYAHELTHYLQYTTTPYGLFLQYCRLLQDQAAIGLARAILEAGQPIRLPLGARAPRLPASDAAGQARAKEARAAFAAWWNIENLVTALNADTGRRAALLQAQVEAAEQAERGEAPERPPILDLPGCFARVQLSLSDFIASFNEAGAAKDPTRPVYPDGIDRAAIEAEPGAPPGDAARTAARTADRAADRAADRMAAAMDLFGDPWDTAAIIESAAVAAEFWMGDLSFERLAAWLERDAGTGQAVYRLCLRRSLDAIPTRDVQSLLLSHMAICELSLFAPLLPQHAGLRRRFPGFAQLLPSRRFTALLSVAGRVPPLRRREDHRAYVNSLMMLLRWVHPDQIIASSLAGPETVRSPIAFLYQSAQRWRSRGSTCFLGVDPWLFGDHPMAERWRAHFNFVVIDYADRTTYHRDKDFLRSMTVRYLEMLGLQTLMRGPHLRMPAPYGRGGAETEWMTAWLRDRFATLFPGREFPGIAFL